MSVVRFRLWAPFLNTKPSQNVSNALYLQEFSYIICPIISKNVHPHPAEVGGVEKSFAEDLEKNEKVKVYAKLPVWFKVQTPLGSYNPDWAVVVENDGEEKLYFVVETKGSTWWDDLRHIEGAKIKCGERHF